MSATRFEPYEVRAHNTAAASENKIHDDTVARRFGFTGGLVPGVEVYAYMTHLPVGCWGRDWLERGRLDCRFAKPVYDGHAAVVTAAEGEGGLDLKVESAGALCATGQASLADAHPESVKLDDFKEAIPSAVRAPADERTLAPETWLGVAPLRLTPDYAAAYLRDVRETDPLYARAGLAHPGVMLRICNWALTHNVVLGPWIHVGSKVENLSAARVGDELSARARVAANYARKGHRLVDLDVLVVANSRTPVARIAHTAIYRPRQVAEAS